MVLGPYIEYLRARMCGFLFLFLVCLPSIHAMFKMTKVGILNAYPVYIIIVGSHRWAFEIDENRSQQRLL